jgi:hypothetical protein
MKASYRDIKQVVGCQEIDLQPGQFIFGRKKAALELGLSEQEIRTIIDFLKKAGNLTIKSTNKYSIITIVNWNTYQGYGEDGQPSDQPTTNHQLTTNKNYKNEKKKEYSLEFLAFYELYPKKEAKYKSFEAWSKINPQNGLVGTIIAAVKNQIAYKKRLKEANQFVPEWPLSVTWLNQRRWEDELLILPPGVAIPQSQTSPFIECPKCKKRVLKSYIEGDGCLKCADRM